MKKLLLILLCLPLLFSSCKKDNNSPQNNSNNNSNNNSSANTYDWYFEIKVDGVSNKIEGSFNNSYIEIDKHIDGPNSAYVSLQG